MSSVAQVMQAVKNVPAEYLDKVMERAENAGETKDAIETQVMKDLDNINSEADVSKAHKNTQSYLKQISAKMTFTRAKAMNALTDAMLNGQKYNLTENNIDTIQDKNFKVVKHFIDAKFDPKDNKEFVARFNEIQGMNLESLTKLAKTASDEDLSVKEVTPFDVARQIKGLEPEPNKMLKNMMYMDSIQDNIKLTKMVTHLKKHSSCYNETGIT